MAYLSPREVQSLNALVTAGDNGLSKSECSKQINASVYMADVSMWLLKTQDFASFRDGRYYVTTAGIKRAKQLTMGINL